MPAERPANHDRGEQSKRASCAQFSVDTFVPRMIHPLLSPNIIQNYLRDDVYLRPGIADMSLHTVDRSVASTIAGIGNPVTYFTSERSRQLHQAEDQARRGFGPAVLDRARELEISFTLNSAQATTRLATPSENVAGDLHREHGYFGTLGWNVYSAIDDGSPVLLLPQTSRKGSTFFQAVDLNELHSRDPEFLPQRIRDHEERYALRTLADTVAYNHGLHEVPEDALIPDTILEVARLSDPAEAGRELGSMAGYLYFLAMVGDFPNTIKEFQEDIYQRSTPMEEGKTAYIESYLSHMGECPSTSEAARQRNSMLTQAYITLGRLDVRGAEKEGLPQKDSPVTQVLRNPSSYTYNVDERDQINTARKDYAQQVSRFLDQTQDITDRDALTEALARDLPETHEALTRFQEWLGTGFSNFDAFLEGTVRRMSWSREGFTLESINAALREELRLTGLGARGDFEGVHIPYTPRDVSIHNPHLEVVLPLLVIQELQTQNNKRALRDAHLTVLQPHNDERAQQLQQSRHELAQSVEDDIRNYDRLLQVSEELKDTYAAFKDLTGITDDDIIHLIDLAKSHTRDEAHFPYGLYKALVNTLYMEKAGLINTKTAPFRTFLGSLFPNYPAAVWENLHSESLQPTDEAFGTQFTDSLREALVLTSESEGPVTWHSAAQPASVNLTYHRLTSLPPEGLVTAVDAVLLAFAPPTPETSAEVMDTRTIQERAAYDFLHRLITHAAPGELNDAERELRQQYDELKSN